VPALVLRSNYLRIEDATAIGPQVLQFVVGGVGGPGKVGVPVSVSSLLPSQMALPSAELLSLTLLATNCCCC